MSGKFKTKPLPHGTNAGYCYWKCRCELCIEAYRDYQREYHIRNRDEKNKKSKEWRAKNPGYDSKRYAENIAIRESKRARSKAWKGRKKSNGCTCANGDAIIDLVQAANGKCVYCKAPYEHIDHFIPLSRGGDHCLANLRPSCAKCNLSKHCKDPADWGAPEHSFREILPCRGDVNV